MGKKQIKKRIESVSSAASQALRVAGKNMDDTYRLKRKLTQLGNDLITVGIILFLASLTWDYWASMAHIQHEQGISWGQGIGMVIGALIAFRGWWIKR